MPINKRYSKLRPYCKVTFSYFSPEAEEVYLVGDFNEWDITAMRMKKNKEGIFKISLDLPNGGEYEYRFFVDGVYINDPQAEKYFFNHYAKEDNSAVSI